MIAVSTLNATCYNQQVSSVETMSIEMKAKEGKDRLRAGSSFLYYSELLRVFFFWFRVLLDPLFSLSFKLLPYVLMTIIL